MLVSSEENGFSDGVNAIGGLGCDGHGCVSGAQLMQLRSFCRVRGVEHNAEQGLEIGFCWGVHGSVVLYAWKLLCFFFSPICVSYCHYPWVG